MYTRAGVCERDWEEYQTTSELFPFSFCVVTPAKTHLDYFASEFTNFYSYSVAPTGEFQISYKIICPPLFFFQ